MSELLTRTFTPDLEVRAKGDGRTIVGIAVPYNRPVRIDSRLTEQFARSTFNDQLGPVLGPDRVLRGANRVRFFREHGPLGGELIGVMSLARDDAAGLYGEFRVSKTPRGDETIELARDGALRHLSVGFRVGPNGSRQLPGGITERYRAEMFEVAITLEGAYGDLAAVAGVRSHDQAEPLGLALDRLDEARQILAGLPVLPSA